MEVAIASTLGCWGERILLLPRYHLATIRSVVWRRVTTNVTLGVATPSVVQLMGWIMNASVIVVRSLAAHGRHMLGGRYGRRRCCVRVALALLARDAVLTRGVAWWCTPTACTRGRNAKFRSGRGRVGWVDIVVMVPVVLFCLRVAVILVVAILGVVLLVGEGIAARVVDSNCPPSFSIRRTRR